MWLFLMGNLTSEMVLNQKTVGNPDFLKWIDWNVYGTAIVWGIVILVHGIKVFGNLPLFIRKWEEHQIEKFLHKNHE